MGCVCGVFWADVACAFMGYEMLQNEGHNAICTLRKFLIFGFPENIIHPISSIEKLFCLALYNRAAGGWVDRRTVINIFYYILQFF
jgi:hypothetical protein